MKLELNVCNDLKWIRVFIIVVAATLLSYSAFYSSVEDWPNTDPKGSLMSGQALLETGSFNLKPYEDELDTFEWQITRREEKILYAYPLGTTFLHLPFIWIATKVGYDLRDHVQEAELNRFFASVSMAFTFILTFLLFRRRTGYIASILFSLVIVLGSNIFSTMGLALWNINYAVISSLGVILLLDSPQIMKSRNTGWIIGVLLFIGFIVRPSFALLILVTFGYLLRFHSLQFLRAATVSALLLCIYIFLSLRIFEIPVTGQYQVQDLSAIKSLGVNFCANFISPSRGFLLFSPVFIFTLVGVFLYYDKSSQRNLLRAIILWLFLLVFLLSSWFMWWGGGGFGNRLFTETMPAWIYLSACFWPELLRQTEKIVKTQILRGSFAVLALFSIWVHVVQGANNQYSVTWLHQPNKDKNPGYFWNFRFPQFLASENQISRMLEWHRDQFLQKRGLQIQTFSAGDDSLEFEGWHSLEGTEISHRWSAEKTVTIKIGSDSLKLPENSDPDWYVLGIEGSTFMGQDIDIYVNDSEVGSIHTARKSPTNTYFTNSFSLRAGEGINVRLMIADPKIPAEELKGYSLDRRELGLSLINLHLYREPTSGELRGK